MTGVQTCALPIYLGLWHFRKSLASNRYLLFFSLWLVAQFTLLTFASSKRVVYLMALTPAAAVVATEYAAVLLQRLPTYRRSLITGTFALVIACYLGAAIWYAPKADRRESFVPMTRQIQALQAQGHNVVLYQPNERVAGATVFYTMSNLPILRSEPQLRAYLDARPGNVALLDRIGELTTPVTTLKQITVGSRPYYFVEQ